TWLGAAGPALICGAVLSKLPQWFGGIVSSARAAVPSKKKPGAVAPDEPGVEPSAAVEEPSPPAPKRQSMSLIDEMLEHNRYSLLLRAQLVGNLSDGQLLQARAALSDGMCLVPDGPVILHPDRGWDESDAELAGGTPLYVSAYYLDRYPVTNAQFHA